MLKVLYIYLRVVKVIGFSVAVSGCWFTGSEQQYALMIDNNLDVSVAICPWSELSSCDIEILSGNNMILYYRHVREGESAVLNAFRRSALAVCGKLVYVRELEEVLPIEHLGGDDYKIVLGKKVSDRYCH